MTKTNYFSHDANARNDGKVLRLRMQHGAAGYGVYFMLLERLRDETYYMASTDYDMMAYDLHVEPELVRSVVEDFGLFKVTEDGTMFYSSSFSRRMEAKDNTAKVRAEAGRKGGLIKQTGSNTETEVKQMESKSQANAKQTGSNAEAEVKQAVSKSQASKVKESKEKKEKEKPTVSADKRACARETDAIASDVIGEAEERKAIDTEAESMAMANGETSAADEDASLKTFDGQLRMLLVNKMWREAVCMNHHISDVDEYRRLLGEFKQECICNAKTQHTGIADLRQHFNSWLRIRLSKAAPNGEAKKEPYVVVPTTEELQRETAKREADETKRVMGIYRSAKEGNARMIQIVSEWAKNGTLKHYGLPEL